MDNQRDNPIPKSSNPFLEDRNENCDADLLSSSYSEINFNCMFGMQSQKTTNHENYEKMEIDGDDESPERETTPKQRPNSLVCDKRKDSEKGEMTTYIADNIEYMIKNSPVSKFDPLEKGGSKNSTPSAAPSRQFHGLASNSAIPKQHIVPQIDSNILNDLEIESQYLASNVDNLTENLTNLLHSISSITVENVDIFKNSVTKLTDAMDSNIKSMYTIIAKTEEISKAMRNAEQLAGRIRDIRRLVDLLESTM